MLHTTLFDDIRLGVDIFPIFRFDPMHFLSLRISRTLKECLIKYLAGKIQTSTAIKWKSGKSKSFLTICAQILSSLNQFWGDTEKGTLTIEKGFLKGFCSGNTSWIFTETGLMKMLEGVDYNNRNLFSPGFGEIVDSMCGGQRQLQIQRCSRLC